MKEGMEKKNISIIKKEEIPHMQQILDGIKFRASEFKIESMEERYFETTVGRGDLREHFKNTNEILFKITKDKDITIDKFSGTEQKELELLCTMYDNKVNFLRNRKKRYNAALEKIKEFKDDEKYLKGMKSKNVDIKPVLDTIRETIEKLEKIKDDTKKQIEENAETAKKGGETLKKKIEALVKKTFENYNNE